MFTSNKSIKDFDKKVAELTAKGYRIVDKIACGTFYTTIMDHPDGDFVTIDIKDGVVYTTHKSKSDCLDPDDDIMDKIMKEVLVGVK